MNSIVKSVESAPLSHNNEINNIINFIAQSDITHQGLDSILDGIDLSEAHWVAAKSLIEPNTIKHWKKCFLELYQSGFIHEGYLNNLKKKDSNDLLRTDLMLYLYSHLAPQTIETYTARIDKENNTQLCKLVENIIEDSLHTKNSEAANHADNVLEMNISTKILNILNDAEEIFSDKYKKLPRKPLVMIEYCLTEMKIRSNIVPYYIFATCKQIISSQKIRNAISILKSFSDRKAAWLELLSSYISFDWLFCNSIEIKAPFLKWLTYINQSDKWVQENKAIIMQNIAWNDVFAKSLGFRIINQLKNNSDNNESSPITSLDAQQAETLLSSSISYSSESTLHINKRSYFLSSQAHSIDSSNLYYLKNCYYNHREADSSEALDKIFNQIMSSINSSTNILYNIGEPIFVYIHCPKDAARNYVEQHETLKQVMKHHLIKVYSIEPSTLELVEVLIP